MRCRCGNEITHVPEHLRDLANWVCQQCTNVAPKATAVADEEKKRQAVLSQKKKAA
ncbi:MAG: hypothetical protein ABFD83_05025 [Armatimonadota bacterium]